MRDTGPPGVSLRPETEADRDFVAALYATTRADEMMLLTHWSDEEKAVFVKSQFEAQHLHYTRSYPGARFEIIEHEGVAIGRLYVALLDGELRLMDITLAPDCRGAGIGTALVEALQAEAAAAGLPMGLHVEPTNPAYHLYTRLGFRFADEAGFYHRMEWAPASHEGQAP